MQRRILPLLILAGLLAAACGRPLAADNEQVSPNERLVIKFSHVVAENTPKGLAARRFAALVKERTGGRVEVQVFPNSQLFRDGEELDALKANNVQLIAPSFSKLIDLDPLWQVFDLPYIFEDQDAVDRLVAGSTGQRLYTNLRKYGMEPLDFWPNGFKEMTDARRPLLDPSDARGLRFRIQPSLTTRDSFAALGAEVSVQSFDSLYSLLSNGEVDGQENTPSNIVSKRVYEVQPYMTMTHHGYLGYVVMTNQHFWYSLSPDLRQVLRQAMDDTSRWVRENADALNAEALERIKASGKVQIHYPTAQEREAWQTAMSPAYKWAEERLGTDAVQTAVQEARGR